MIEEPSEPTRGRAGTERARYDRDLYSWAIEQAELLRAGRISEADALNIAEELDDVGNEQYDKLESALQSSSCCIFSNGSTNRNGVRVAGR